MGEYESLSMEDLRDSQKKIKSELNHILKTSENIGTLQKEELADPVDEANSNIRVSHDLRMKNRELFYIKKLKASLERFDKNNMVLQ